MRAAMSADNAYLRFFSVSSLNAGRFTAETLGENSAMLGVFADAGLLVRRRMADGVPNIYQ